MKNFIGAVALVALSACASATQAGDPAKSIPQLNAGFSDAVRRGDAAAVASYYADTAVMMPPNMPAARGRDAIRQTWSGLLASGKIDLALMTDNLIQSCDLATEVGHFDFSLTPPGAAAMRDKGKYAVTWKNIGGQWRIVVDIFNSDLPATAPH